MTTKRDILPRAPKTEAPEFRAWLDKLKFIVENTIQSISHYPTGLGTGAAILHGKHSSFQLQNGETGYYEFVLPWAIKEIKEVGIRIIGTTTGTINYTVNLSYGGVGDDENATTKTVSETLYAVTDDQIQEIDITELFTDQERGDQIAVEIIVDAVATTTDIHLLDLFLKYI